MLCCKSHMTVLLVITCVVNVRNQRSQAFVTCCCPFCDCVPRTGILRQFESRHLQNFSHCFKVFFFNWWSSRHGVETVKNCSIILFAKWQWFNAFLRLSFHVVGPRVNVCTNFLRSRNFSVAPAEIRDSNISLSSSTILSFGLHSRWVHLKYTWSRNVASSSSSTCR